MLDAYQIKIRLFGKSFLAYLFTFFWKPNGINIPQL